jgi:GTP cyclohydrolase IA
MNMKEENVFTQVVEPLQDVFVVSDTDPEPFSLIDCAVRDILVSIGENPERQGLQKTPERVRRMYDELTSGYHTDPVKLINGALFDVEYDEMVLVKDIEFYSMCEHHMLPFLGKVHVAYIPNGKVIGLSKIPRIVEMFARRLQVQERMTTEIAQFIEQVLQPRGVAVFVEGAHMCSVMRGVKKPDARMSTNVFLGEFKTDKDLRAEFLAQVNAGDHR